MTNQPMSGMGGMLPGVAAGGGLRDEDDENRSTDGGVPVGEADKQADAERTGAGDDEAVADPGGALMSDDVVGRAGSDDDVPTGAADAEADRERTTDGD